jgi:pimeloyl-ACP methyl ester carboxylesterase
MGKTIVLIHGRAPKPPRTALKKLWLDALRWGVKRDHPQKLGAFDRATIEFAYFGDISTSFLNEGKYDATADLADRRRCLKDLKTLTRNDFSDAARYSRLPGVSGAGELYADVAGGFLSTMRLGELIIAGVAPDIKEYWNLDSDFGSNVRWPAISPLLTAFNKRDRVMVIAHSLGSMVAFDTLWKLSYLGEYRPRYNSKVIDRLVTIGSPLADETVKRHLKGAQASGPRRYPVNVRRWINVAAVDDFISHDEKVADDYRKMLEYKQIESIEDARIYNMATRDGKSNPHHSCGYLVHPVISETVAEWL